jgi:hypothetical protein
MDRLSGNWCRNSCGGFSMPPDGTIGPSNRSRQMNENRSRALAEAESEPESWRNFHIPARRVSGQGHQLNRKGDPGHSTIRGKMIFSPDDRCRIGGRVTATTGAILVSILRCHNICCVWPVGSAAGSGRCDRSVKWISRIRHSLMPMIAVGRRSRPGRCAETG